MSTLTKSKTATETVLPVAAATDPTARLNPGDVRSATKLSKSDFADLLGMSETGYALWESGARKAGGPAYRLLHLIAQDGTNTIETLRGLKY